MACSLLSKKALDGCSFVEREKHRIDLSFEGEVTEIDKSETFSKITFNKITAVIHSDIRHIFNLGQLYRVSIWNDGSADFERL